MPAGAHYYVITLRTLQNISKADADFFGAPLYSMHCEGAARASSELAR